MAVQQIPFALQNASHSAALFRQAQSSPFLTSGALGSVELLVTQQGSPNMSVILGAGRAKVLGNSVSAPAGQVWTTQAMYDVLNDAAATLTVAASNPTNPRIDLVYIQVQDSFYSGAANQAIAGVVTGTPAVSPAVPATPTNAIAIATVAVAANATSIVTANIARVVSTVTTVGGLYPTATPTTLAALQTAATLPNPSRVTVLSNGSEWYWNGTTFTLDNTPRIASSAARDALYVAPVAVVTGDSVYRTDTLMTQVYDGTRWRYVTPGNVPVIPASVVNGTIGTGGAVTFTGITTVSLNGIFTADYENYTIIFEAPTKSVAGNVNLLLRVGGADNTTTNYDFERLIGSGSAASAGATSASNIWSSFHGLANYATTIATMTMLGPQIVQRTYIQNNVLGTDNVGNIENDIYYGAFRATTSFDGVTFAPSTGTMTGTIRVYGWNNN